MKAKVLASMKQMSYDVQVTLSINSGFVVDASCHCKSSVLGRCSHVGAVLVAMKSCLLNIEQNTACTSKPCEWNMGCKTGKDPGKVTEVTYKGKKAVGGVIKFYCRPPPLPVMRLARVLLMSLLCPFKTPIEILLACGRCFC